MIKTTNKKKKIRSKSWFYGLISIPTANTQHRSDAVWRMIPRMNGASPRRRQTEQLSSTSIHTYCTIVNIIYYIKCAYLCVHAGKGNMAKCRTGGKSVLDLFI